MTIEFLFLYRQQYTEKLLSLESVLINATPDWQIQMY